MPLTKSITRNPKVMILDSMIYPFRFAIEKIEISDLSQNDRSFCH